MKTILSVVVTASTEIGGGDYCVSVKAKSS